MATYKVFTKANKLLASGTAQECGEILGVSGKTVVTYARACRNGEACEYKVIADDPNLKVCGNAAAIKAWDDFITPIREYYGIPIRPLGENKK